MKITVEGETFVIEPKKFLAAVCPPKFCSPFIKDELSREYVCKYCGSIDCKLASFMFIDLGDMFSLEDNIWINIDVTNKCIDYYKNEILTRKYNETTGEVKFFFEDFSLNISSKERDKIDRMLEMLYKEYNVEEMSLHRLGII